MWTLAFLLISVALYSVWYWLPQDGLESDENIPD